MKKINGFTLIESMVGLSISALAVGGVMTYQAQEAEKELSQRFVDETYDIVKAVDHRIAIDGYDPALWSKTSWSTESDIVSDLIGKHLTSQHLTTCSGGDWNPVLSSEEQTKLIACQQWKTRKNNGETMKAYLSLDGSGFINGFNLLVSYTNSNDFKDNFMNLKKSLLKSRTKIDQELTGSHYIDIISIAGNSTITSSQCLQNFTDCALRFSIDRNGGNEYLRADGGNSMIGEHLTFIETKGQAPMKCLRWKKDNSGAWTSRSDEDCGIGVYKDLNHPAVVDVVGVNGTFENVLLNKDCNVFEPDGANGIKKQMSAGVEVKSPCGMLEEAGEIIQVVDNIHTANIYSENASFNVSNIEVLVADSISSNTLKVANLSELADVTMSGTLTVTGLATFDDDLNVSKDISSSNGFATTKMKAPVGDFDNINNEISTLKSAINGLKSSVTSAWSTGSWSACSATCGGGIQSRSVYCSSNKICTGTMPAASQSCNTHACPVYYWRSTGNSSQSNYFGSQQTQNAQCSTKNTRGYFRTSSGCGSFASDNQTCRYYYNELICTN